MNSNSYSRFAVTVLVILSTVLALIAKDLVFWLILFAWAGMGASIAPHPVLAPSALPSPHQPESESATTPFPHHLKSVLRNYSFPYHPELKTSSLHSFCKAFARLFGRF